HRRTHRCRTPSSFPLPHRRLPRSTLFPYTTLFRSRISQFGHHADVPRVQLGDFDPILPHGHAEVVQLFDRLARRVVDVLAVLDGPRVHSEKRQDRKSTRLNSSHVSISYAVFCLKKKNKLNPLFTINVTMRYIHSKNINIR